MNFQDVNANRLHSSSPYQYDSTSPNIIEDVLHDILGYFIMYPAELLHMSQVNRTWRTMVFNSPLWLQMNLLIFPSNIFCLIRCQLPRRQRDFLVSSDILLSGSETDVQLFTFNVKQYVLLKHQKQKQLQPRDDEQLFSLENMECHGLDPKELAVTYRDCLILIYSTTTKFLQRLQRIQQFRIFCEKALLTFSSYFHSIIILCLLTITLCLYFAELQNANSFFQKQLYLVSVILGLFIIISFVFVLLINLLIQICQEMISSHEYWTLNAFGFHTCTCISNLLGILSLLICCWIRWVSRTSSFSNPNDHSAGIFPLLPSIIFTVTGWVFQLVYNTRRWSELPLPKRTIQIIVASFLYIVLVFPFYLAVGIILYNQAHQAISSNQEIPIKYLNLSIMFYLVPTIFFSCFAWFTPLKILRDICCGQYHHQLQQQLQQYWQQQHQQQTRLPLFSFFVVFFSLFVNAALSFSVVLVLISIYPKTFSIPTTSSFFLQLPTTAAATR
jgi:hypothetical protein